MLGHEYTKSVRVKEPTAAYKGILRYYCSRGDYYYDEPIPELIPFGGTVRVNGKQAVITLKDGNTVTVPKDTISVSENLDGTYTVIFDDDSSVTVTPNSEVSKGNDGQVVVKATDEGQTTTVIVPSGSSVVKENDHYTVKIITNNTLIKKTVKKGEAVIVDKTGKVVCNGAHKWDDGKVTKAATTTSTGVKTYTCIDCSATRTETIAKLPTPAMRTNPSTPATPSTPAGQTITEKKSNTLKAKQVKKTVTVKYKKLKKKGQSIKLKKYLKVTKAKGMVSYKKVKGNKKITVNKKTGKITLKKGLKKGTYKVKIKVTAKGNATYNKGTKTVTVTIKVK